FTPRADPRDVLVAGPGRWLATLPPGASVATSSVRRSAQILHFRPDLRTVPIRGNIDTRLGKLDSGVYDALCLAGAGLVRMDWQERISEWLEPEIMLPAPGQGALGIAVADHLLADSGFALDVVRSSASAGPRGNSAPPAAPRDGPPRGPARKDLAR